MTEADRNLQLNEEMLQDSRKWFFFLYYFYIYQICNKVGEGAIQEGQCLLVGYTRRGWGGGGVVKVVKIQGRKREGLGLGFQIEGHC